MPADRFEQTDLFSLRDSVGEMRKHLSLEERLEILRQHDRFRKWNSLDDERICIVCDQTFTGRQIEMRRDQRGRYFLQCPTEGCPSYIAHWFYVGSASKAASAVFHGMDGEHAPAHSLGGGFETNAS